MLVQSLPLSNRRVDVTWPGHYVTVYPSHAARQAAYVAKRVDAPFSNSTTHLFEFEVVVFTALPVMTPRSHVPEHRRNKTRPRVRGRRVKTKRRGGIPQ
jgi:hypothetical protein